MNEQNNKILFNVLSKLKDLFSEIKFFLKRFTVTMKSRFYIKIYIASNAFDFKILDDTEIESVSIRSITSYTRFMNFMITLK